MRVWVVSKEFACALWNFEQIAHVSELLLGYVCVMLGYEFAFIKLDSYGHC